MNSLVLLIICIAVLVCGYIFYGGWLCKQWGVGALGVTARGRNIEEAVKNAYEAASRISWQGMQYRSDIAKRAFNR